MEGYFPWSGCRESARLRRNSALPELALDRRVGLSNKSIVKITWLKIIYSDFLFCAISQIVKSGKSRLF